MKLVVDRSNLFKVLNHVQSVVEKKTTVPILSCVLIEAFDGKITISGTDLESAMIESTEARVEVAGACSVPAHVLFDIVKKIPDGREISMVIDDSSKQIEITSGKSEYKFSILSAEDFPKLNKNDLPVKFTIPAKDLLLMLERTRFAMGAADDARYYLNGIYLHVVNGNELRAVATDGHKLARYSVDLPKGAEEMPGVIVSRKTVNEVIRLLAETNTDVEVHVSDTQISFNIENAYFTSRLIDGKYPDYNRAIPKTNDKVLQIKMSDFISAVDRVATLAGDKEKGVNVRLSNNKLVLQTTNPGKGSGHEEVEVDYSDDELEIGFNSKYLLDMGQQIANSQAEILVLDSTTPVLIRDLQESKALYVMMPLRT